MQVVGIIGQGENPNAQEATDALLTLNEIIDKWNTESLMIPYSAEISIPLNGKEKYTIGTTGDVNSLRPVAGITSAYFLDNNINYPIEVLTKQQYDDILVKDFNSSFTNYVYYNGTYPNAELYVYPQSNTGNIILNVNGQLTIIDNLDAVIDLPAGYIKALRYGLAVEIAPEFGKEVSSQIVELAVGAKNTIKANNKSQKPRLLRTDSALMSGYGGFNIYTGE